MDRVQDSVMDFYVRWLASAFVCCAPQARKSGGEKQGLIRDGSMEEQYHQQQQVYFYQQQPQYTPPASYAHNPPTVPRAARPRTRSSVHPSEWAARSRSLASRASSRGSIYLRRRTMTNTSSHRPVISGPSNFQKVDGLTMQMQLQQRQPQHFAPLELSIHTPRHKLSPLPSFDPAGLEYSSHQGSYGRAESVFSMTPSEFKIPRKPVPSMQGLSYDYHLTRHSVDARSTPSTMNTEWSIQPLRSRPSLPVSASTQELLAALQARLPPPPHAPPPSTRPRANTEPAQDLKRTSSETALRVRVALEEKQALEATLAKLSKKLSLGRKNVRLPEDSPSIEEEEQRPAVPAKQLNRSATFSAVSNILARPLPTDKPTPPLPTAPALAPPPAISRTPSFQRITKWLFPTNVPPTTTSSSGVEATAASKAASFYQCRDAAALIPFSSSGQHAEHDTESLVSERSSSWLSSSSSSTIADDDDLLSEKASVPTETPNSTPGREYPPARHSTFGRASKVVRVVECPAPRDQRDLEVERAMVVGVAF